MIDNQSSVLGLGKLFENSNEDLDFEDNEERKRVPKIDEIEDLESLIIPSRNNETTPPDNSKSKSK